MGVIKNAGLISVASFLLASIAAAIAPGRLIWAGAGPLANRMRGVELPGHGATPADADSGTFMGLADAVERFIDEQGLAGYKVCHLHISFRKSWSCPMPLHVADEERPREAYHYLGSY